MDIIQNTDEQLLINELESNSTGNFYLTPNFLVINLVVPHVVGDNCDIQIPWQSINRLPFDSKYDSNLCLDTEIWLISFRIDHSEKRVSVCVSNDDDPYLVYRFGTMNHIEMEYPPQEKNSWDNFSYFYDLSEGSSGNNETDMNFLSFTSNGYEYKIYENYDASSEIPIIGVEVTDLSTGEKTDIKGNSNSLIGSLTGLRYSKYIKVIELTGS